MVEYGIFMLSSKLAAVKGQTEARKLLIKRDNFLPADVVKFHTTATATPSNYKIHDSSWIDFEVIQSRRFSNN